MTQQLARILHDADRLSPDEQMLLIAHLAQRSRRSATPRRWAEIRGRAPGLSEGEDVQTWVTQSRRHDDQQGSLGL
jgi:hypothetical protein